MIVKEHFIKEHPEDGCYKFTITTDSSYARGIIKNHLDLAQKEYFEWLKKFSKTTKENNNE